MKKSGSRPHKMSWSARLKELRTIIRMCFVLIDETDYKEIANRTHLSISTLHRIQSDKLTLNVRFGTIQALCCAAGVKLEARECGYNLVLSD